MQDKAGNKDQSFVFNNKKGALVSTLTFTAQGHLNKGPNVELARLSLAAYGAPATLASITLQIKGTATASDLSKAELVSNTGAVTFPGTLSGSTIVFSMGTYQVLKDNINVLNVKVDISASATSGETIGLEFAGFTAVSSDANSLTMLESPSINAYIDTPQTKIVIDGAFDDWNSVATHPDPADMTANSNIDLRDVKLNNDASNVFFYFRVDGKVMMGTNSPRALVRPTSGPGGPGGPQPPLPVVYGADVAYIFIDTDHDATTGYSVETIGADYLLEIMGVGGSIDRGQYEKFAGANPGVWSWTKINSISYANDATRVECSVSSTSLNIGIKGFQAVVRMTDWEKHTDTLNEVLSGSGNRTLPIGHPDLKTQVQIDLNNGYPLHAPEFKDMLVPLLGTVVIVVIIRRRKKNKK